MYIIKNAWKSITRSKARNFLMGIIALVIAISACLALSIRQAAETAKEDTLSTMTVTAQISYDRSAAMSEMRQQGENSEEGSSREMFDFDQLSGESLSLDEYMTYTEAQTDGDSYYYTLTSSLNATGDLLPYGEEEAAEEEETATDGSETTDEFGGMTPGGMGGGAFSFEAQGDFSLTGYSSYSAMLSLFGEDGNYSITDGQMFDEGTSDMVCVISDELAMYNDLEVGDVITLANPNYEDETYTLTICGIYTNAESDTGNSMFSFSDPANNIYLSEAALQVIIDESAAAANTVTNDDGEEEDAALTNEMTFTYVFSEVDHYYTFEEEVYTLGLAEDYTVSSSDLAAFENSVTPLETLSTMAGWFFLIVLIIGGIILTVLSMFNIRERKYEVGVLTAIGMKKGKVALQFVSELFIITSASILIGAVIGAAVSVPVTNTLLENQIASSSASNQQVTGNFGFDNAEDMQDMSGMGDRMARTGGDAAMGSVNYIDSVSSATNLTVVLQLVGVGLLLTIVSSLTAVVAIMRYEPLKILSNRG